VFGIYFPQVQVNTTRFIDDIVRVGFNYKFDPHRAAVVGMPVKAPALPPSLSWTGFYVGVNAGHIDSVGRTNTDVAVLSIGDFTGGRFAAAGNAFNLVSAGVNQFNHHFGGSLGGVQAGYNYQFSPTVVAGLEADIQGTELAQDWATTLTTGQGPFWVTSTTVADRLEYLGTVRGRLGVTPTPDLLIYSTGGLAYGRVRSSTQIAFNNTGGAIPGTTAASFSDTRVGWTAGGGLELKFSANWSGKFEYLYYDLGSATYPTGGYAADVSPTGFPGFGVVSVATSTTTRFNGNIGRIGLNYQFGG
jgi:outer membrane immunogenic protein